MTCKILAQFLHKSCVFLLFYFIVNKRTTLPNENKTDCSGVLIIFISPFFGTKLMVRHISVTIKRR